MALSHKNIKKFDVDFDQIVHCSKLLHIEHIIICLNNQITHTLESLHICDVLHDLVSVTIWRLYDRLNACKLHDIFYLPVVSIRLYELA